MSIALLAHVHGDGDILQAWIDHYVNLGVSAFHLVVRGNAELNARLLALAASHPMFFRDTYEGPFQESEKVRRLNALLGDFHGQWIMVVDPDEFLELPCTSLAETIRGLERFDATCLGAPLLQRLRSNGSLDSPAEITDPFREFPLCSVNLYQTMGSDAALGKYPLLHCGPATAIQNGNHTRPNGPDSARSPFRGVSHHFKWRRPALGRIQEYVDTLHPHWWESAAYLTFLEQHGGRLPLDDAFPYSREELFRRRLLRRMAWYQPAQYRLRRWAERLPQPLAAVVRMAYGGLRDRRNR